MMGWDQPCGAGNWGLGGWSLLHGGFMLLVIAGLVLGAFLLVRLASGGTRGASPSRPAGLAVLEERYAKGEIERDEYLQKKQDIVA